MNYKSDEVINVNAENLEKAEDAGSYIQGAVDAGVIIAEENRINWKQKLTSRKLWAAIAGLAVGIAAAFGLTENDWAQIAGVVTSAISVVAYIFGEASVDAARASGKEYNNIMQ